MIATIQINTPATDANIRRVRISCLDNQIVLAVLGLLRDNLTRDEPHNLQVGIIFGDWRDRHRVQFLHNFFFNNSVKRKLACKINKRLNLFFLGEVSFGSIQLNVLLKVLWLPWPIHCHC